MPNKAENKLKLLHSRKEEAELEAYRWLRAAGWQHTNKTPNARWMWVKEWRGERWTYFTVEQALEAASWMEDYRLVEVPQSAY
jgi:hypothetical protein